MVFLNIVYIETPVEVDKLLYIPYQGLLN